MKFIIENDILYSLENVKRVSTETKFVNGHVPFFYVNIDYTDGTRYSISCGHTEDGKYKAGELLKTIANILSGYNVSKLGPGLISVKEMNRIKLQGVKEFWAELENRNTLDERLRSVETGNKIIEELENKQV